MSNRPSTQTAQPRKPGPQLPGLSTTKRNTKTAVGPKPDAPEDKAAPDASTERHQLIAVAAYYIAQRRGFAPGNELDDWLQAEAEITAGGRPALQ